MEYFKSEDNKEILEKVFLESEFDFGHIDEEKFLVIDAEGDAKKRYLAKIKKMSILESYLCDKEYEYVIIVNKDLMLNKSEEFIFKVLEHELMHIDINGKIIDHNLQDFKEIIEKYGTRWTEEE